MEYLNPTTADFITINLLKNGYSNAAFITGGYAYSSLSPIIEKRGIIVAQSSWNVMTTSLALLAGFFLYNEQLDQKKILGLGLGISGLLLMNS